MKNSWRHYLRRLALASVVCGYTAWSAATCYAVQLAFDSADDPVYADGWQTGDNGGTGFTAWNFDSSYFWPVDGNWYAYSNPAFHAIDDGLQAGTHYSNSFNNVGRSWAMGIAPDGDGPPRAGRGFDPLQIGQSLKVVFDNPTDRQFFKGYFIRLSSTFDTDINGDPINGNICNGAGANCTPNGTPPARKMYLSRFEYFDDGEWRIVDSGNPDSTATGVFDTDTAAAGALFQVTRTGEDTYDVLLDPFGPAPSYTLSETFANPGAPVNWIEFTFFNTVTDSETPPTLETDLYIRSVEIVDATPADLLGDYNDDGTVNTADFVVWQKLNGTSTQLPNDPNPLPIDTDQYNTWRTNFGDTAGTGGSAASGAAPEPAPVLLLVIGALFGKLSFHGWRPTRDPLCVRRAENGHEF
jgi:hypothetical protein